MTEGIAAAEGANAHAHALPILGFSVNCSMLFADRPLLERPAVARACGFAAVEFWWPFEHPTPADRDIDRFIDVVGNSGAALASLNLYAGDREAGERGIVCLPKRTAEFDDNLAIAVEIGRRLGCRTFNALYGNIGPDDDAQRARETATRNLAVAAQTVSTFGGQIVVEALSDPTPYPLRTSHDVGDVIAAVHRSAGVTNVKLLADLYHLATNGDDLDALFADRVGMVGHVQVADVPGRHEPGTGNLPVRRYLQALARGGYAGWVGVEYLPTLPAPETFGWLARLATDESPGDNDAVKDGPSRSR